LGTRLDTTIQGGSGQSTISLGGYGPTVAAPAIPLLPAPAPVLAITQALAGEIGGAVSTDPQGNPSMTISAPETLASFNGPIAIAGGWSTPSASGPSLILDDSQDANSPDLLLGATSMSGFSSPGAGTIPFSGIRTMTVDAGLTASAGLFTVQQQGPSGAGAITVNFSTPGANTPATNVLVEPSTAPLVFNGPTAVQGPNTITFDASGVTSPMTDASLHDSSSYSGDAELTGFGPTIQTIDFSGFQQANLNLGQNLNTLTI